ncbi:hypothetical protein PAEPH01_0105 [Pancytospora epiphaga]|nr:hypothetical protein PAEPH01_0105 [Pancytospora epiphaga]
MMLLAMFTILERVTRVKAVSNKITLNFTNKDAVVYDISKVSISASEFITGCRRFKEMCDMKAEKNTVIMNCSSQTFSIIDKLIDGNDFANEFTLNVVYKVLKELEYLQYEDKIRIVIHERLLEHILPDIVYSIMNEKRSDNYMKSNNECVNTDIENQIKLILSLFLSKHGLGLDVNEDIISVCKDPENKYSKNVLNSEKVSRLKIFPEVLNGDIRGKEETDKKQRLGMMLWMFNEFIKISELDLSGCILTDEHIEQLSGIKCLKALNLSECTLKPSKNYNTCEIGFKVLEELNISGVKFDVKIANILCKINKLKKLEMEKCFLKPEIKFEFIEIQTNLEELRIGKNHLNEEQLDVIFSHENIKILDMDMCTVEEMYIYGGKIENLEILKLLNNGEINVESNEIRITLLEVNNRRYLKKWKAYNGCLMFFGDEGIIKIGSSEEDKEEINESAVDGTTGVDNFFTQTRKRRIESIEKNPKKRKLEDIEKKLNELNGSKIFFENDREIKIILPQTNNILGKLKGYENAAVYFIGEEKGKMNFLDTSKGKRFLKNVEEYNCGQVYFEDKHIEMILSHRGLKRLSMRQCGLESEAIVKLKDRSTLKELDLSNNNLIGEDDLLHIIKECPNLRKLNVNCCRMLVTKDFRGISMLESLRELDISGNKLNYKCCEYIFKHNGILRLNLEGCGLTENSLKEIDNLNGLKTLYIGDNFIDKRDIDKIFRLKELEVLSMPKCRLFVEEYYGYVDVDGIKALRMLKSLDISNNDLFDVEIDEIFELSELRDLRMKNCEINPGNLKKIYKLENLERLDISKNGIGKQDMDAVTNLKKLKELNMFNCWICGEQVFENVARLNNSLVVLDIAGYVIHSNQNINRVGGLTNLQELRLMENVPFKTICDILKGMKCLRVLCLGTVDTESFIDNEKAPLELLKMLELKCTHVNTKFIEGLDKLTNLKELILVSTNSSYNFERSNLDISLFPRGLRKLKVSGRYSYSINSLVSGSHNDDPVILESLEELQLFNIEKIPEEVIEKIASCTKLRKLELQMGPYSFPTNKLKEIERIVALEELILEEIDLSGENGMWLRGLKQLRQLKLCNCKLNEKCLKEIEKIKCLEALNIAGNDICYFMNGILELKNLRKLRMDKISLDYNKKGNFALIKGFEILEYSEWTVYNNNKSVAYGDTDFDGVVADLKLEATLNNWKGIRALSNWCVEIDSAIFLAVSSRLVFIESISLSLCNELRGYKEDTEILKNCLMLREIKWTHCNESKCMPLSMAINIIDDKPLLQIIGMFVDDFSIEFSSLLSECEYVYKIVLHTQKYKNGVFKVLFEDCKTCVFKSVEVSFGAKRWYFSMNFTICFADNGNAEGKIRRFLSKEDMDAIIEAREEGIHVSISLFVD